MESAPAARDTGSTRPAAPPTRSGSTTVGVALTGLAALLLGFIGYLLLLTPQQQSRDQEVAYDVIRESLGRATTPFVGAIPGGTPIGVIEIPRLGLRQVVMEGTSSAILASGPGHRSTSPMPGQPGVSILHGRAATFGAPFADLPRLAPGDEVVVVTGQGRFAYLVDGVRRAGDPVPGPPAPGGSRLMMITADRSAAWPAGLTASTSILLDATLQGPTQPGGARASVIAPPEQPMQIDPAAVIGLFFWVQVLLGVTVASAWAWHRWGRWETWLTGGPAFVAALWQVFEAGALLLPNLV